MSVSNIVDIFSSIVTVGLVFVLVSNPGTSMVIRAIGDAFSNSLETAMGR